MSVSDNYDDWLADGRREAKERIQGGDEEYEERIKEESPYLYWSWEWTPDPPEDVVEELGLNE